VNKQHHSGIAQDTALRQAALLRSMIGDLERTFQILPINICTEEKHLRVFDKADPLYPVPARTLKARSDNLKTMVTDLKQRLTLLTANECLPAAA
jgi:hypothetical protein